VVIAPDTGEFIVAQHISSNKGLIIVAPKAGAFTVVQQVSSKQLLIIFATILQN